MSGDDERLWAELVETFHASPDEEKRRWPEEENVDADDSEAGDADATMDAPAEKPQPSTAGHGAPPELQATEAADHYIPPPPPPFPQADAITVLAWVAVLGTPVFLTATVLLGRSVSGWLGAVLAGAFIGGFVLLITRLRGHDPYDPDDGAVV